MDRKIEWEIDSDNEQIDPKDGGEPFVYWWEDMRAREVRELVREVYERGFEAGRKSVVSFVALKEDGHGPEDG